MFRNILGKCRVISNKVFRVGEVWVEEFRRMFNVRIKFFKNFTDRLILIFEFFWKREV